MAEQQPNEALEKLNQGIRKTKQMVQLQAMELAQEYFGYSVEALKQQVKENRAALQGLPKKVPWGQEEPFQFLFQELIENYATIEKSLDEARKNAANLDTEQLREQGEFNATVAAIREAKKRGIDLREVEGTGSGGRIVVGDVRRVAKEAEHEAAEDAEHETAEKEEAVRELKAPDAAKHRAGELDTDLAEVDGTGSRRLTTGNGVMSFAEEEREKATGVEERITDNGQISGNEDAEEPNATNAAKYKAEELGVELKEVEGTGFGGLITMSDVLKKAG